MDTLKGVPRLVSLPFQSPLWLYCSLNGAAMRRRSSSISSAMTNAAALKASATALVVAFLAPLGVIFLASLAVEDQRAFLSCRQSGQSVDACMLQIHGR
ncbi:MAG: hypothetical protein CML73_03070 [Rhodobiaceae bacterium]|nr:hypothetical protein [Rhodobiaceae bacterium]